MIKYIDQVSKDNTLKITTVYQDMLKGIPKKFENYFDVFITDPTPTTRPMTLFTSLGVKMLKKAVGKVGYISLYPSHMERDINLQKNLSKMDLVITDMVPHFNEYDFVKFTYSKTDLELLRKYAEPKEQKISFWEYFMRFETTRNTKPINIHLTAKDLLGRATRRVLDDPSKDPVLSKKGSSDFIEKMAKDMQSDFLKK